MSQTWKFGGTDLSTFGTITLLDDPMDLPDRRGSDITIPYQHGSIHTDKYYDSRTIAFGIAIRDSTISGMQTKFDNLRKLIAPKAQQTLEYTLDDATIRTAQAVVNKKMNVVHETILLARVVVEFYLARPFFRLNTAIADNTTVINANPKAMTVTNPGSVEECDPIIILTGPLANTVITNSTNGCVLTYAGTIASPRVVTIQTSAAGEYTATDDLGTNVIGNIGHSGAPSLMVINPGANALSIADDTHTTGTVKISFNAPFL